MTGDWHTQFHQRVYPRPIQHSQPVNVKYHPLLPRQVVDTAREVIQHHLHSWLETYITFGRGWCLVERRDRTVSTHDATLGLIHAGDQQKDREFWSGRAIAPVPSKYDMGGGSGEVVLSRSIALLRQFRRISHTPDSTKRVYLERTFAILFGDP